MPTVVIPAMLRPLTGGAAKAPAAGATLRAVLEDLERQHPALKGRVLEDGALRPEVFVAIGSVEAFGLDVAVESDAEVFILPAIAGGCDDVLPSGRDDGDGLARFCAELRRWRLERRFTQEQVAQAVGTSQARISRIEHASELPRLDFLFRMCEMLELDLRVESHGGAS